MNHRSAQLLFIYIDIVTCTVYRWQICLLSFLHRSHGLPVCNENHRPIVIVT